MAGRGSVGIRRGLSRRDMIRRSVVAGAAAWTAPAILDSLASPAAAGSIPCTGTSVTLSWIYVLYKVGSDYFVTGFSKNDSSCNAGGANPDTHGTKCAFCSVTGVSFTLNNFNPPPDPATNDATYGLSGCLGTQSNNWTYEDDSSCGTYITFQNGSIVSQNGATIMAAVGFGAGHLIPICPNNGSPGNSLCGIENALT